MAFVGEPLIEVCGVSKVYETFPLPMRMLLRAPTSEPVRALDNVSLTLGPGEACVVVGPNGAGKSTLFRILTGLTTPSDGWARIDGLDSTRHARQVRHRIGFAPAEDRTLLLRHSSIENLAFHGAMQGMSGKSLDRAITDTLEFVGLGSVADRAAVALSTGMKARLQLARALLHEPKVLLLDEPTSAIDPLAAREIIRLVLEAARDRGAAVLISSHRLEEIETLQERVVVLDEGKIVYSGDLEVLRSRWTQPSMEISFSNAASAADARSRLIRQGRSVAGESPSHSILLNDVTSPAEAISLLGDDKSVIGVAQRTPTLIELLERVSKDKRS